ESSVNYIWKVEKPRSIARRFSDYMSVLLTGPVLIFSALGLKALFLSHRFIQRLLSIEVFGLLFYALGKTIPFVFICLSFTFVIIFIPNTKVRFRSALLGGVISGVSWQFTGWVFSTFVVTSARYVAVYSSFAVLFLFILWLYLNWLIVLIGAQVAYCHQNIETFYVKRKVVEYGGRLKEKLCFLVMYLVGFHFHWTGNRLTAVDITGRLGQSATHVNKTLDLLEKEGLLLQTADDPPAYLPARDIDTIKLTDILDVARTPAPEETVVEEGDENLHRVDELLSKLEGALRGTLGELTLKDFVAAREAVSPAVLKAKN
ncbi:MAG: YhjD/YihY/BrkB family envelope integrity protein, partial [Candidatus Methanosuratincola sp.]